jgi:hypothetical protein
MLTLAQALAVAKDITVSIEANDWIGGKYGIDLEYIIKNPSSIPDAIYHT